MCVCVYQSTLLISFRKGSANPRNEDYLRIICQCFSRGINAIIYSIAPGIALVYCFFLPCSNFLPNLHTVERIIWKKTSFLRSMVANYYYVKPHRWQWYRIWVFSINAIFHYFTNEWFTKIFIGFINFLKLLLQHRDWYSLNNRGECGVTTLRPHTVSLWFFGVTVQYFA